MKATDRAPLGDTEAHGHPSRAGDRSDWRSLRTRLRGEAHAVVERAWEHGLRFFDTAPLYGYGLSEQRLGHVLREKPRADAVVSTKVGRLLRADATPDPAQSNWRGVPDLSPVFDFSRDGVLRSFEEAWSGSGSSVDSAPHPRPR